MQPKDGNAKDCAALVQMSSVEEATKALEALHNKVLAAPMPPMRVRYAGKEEKPGSNLYVAGLPLGIQEFQIRLTFEKCGTIARLRLLTQAQQPETHALVQMLSQAEAEHAIKTLNGQPPESVGMALIVRYASEPKPQSAANTNA